MTIKRGDYVRAHRLAGPLMWVQNVRKTGREEISAKCWYYDASAGCFKIIRVPVRLLRRVEGLGESSDKA